MIVGLENHVYQNSIAKNVLNRVKASVSSFLASVKEAFTLPSLEFAVA